MNPLRGKSQGSSEPSPFEARDNSPRGAPRRSGARISTRSARGRGAQRGRGRVTHQPPPRSTKHVAKSSPETIKAPSTGTSSMALEKNEARLGRRKVEPLPQPKQRTRAGKEPEVAEDVGPSEHQEPELAVMVESAPFEQAPPVVRRKPRRRYPGWEYVPIPEDFNNPPPPSAADPMIHDDISAPVGRRTRRRLAEDAARYVNKQDAVGVVNDAPEVDRHAAKGGDEVGQRTKAGTSRNVESRKEDGLVGMAPSAVAHSPPRVRVPRGTTSTDIGKEDAVSPVKRRRRQTEMDEPVKVEDEHMNDSKVPFKRKQMYGTKERRYSSKAKLEDVFDTSRPIVVERFPRFRNGLKFTRKTQHQGEPPSGRARNTISTGKGRPRNGSAHQPGPSRTLPNDLADRTVQKRKGKTEDVDEALSLGNAQNGQGGAAVGNGERGRGKGWGKRDTQAQEHAEKLRVHGFEEETLKRRESGKIRKASGSDPVLLQAPPEPWHAFPLQHVPDGWSRPKRKGNKRPPELKEGHRYTVWLRGQQVPAEVIETRRVRISTSIVPTTADSATTAPPEKKRKITHGVETAREVQECYVHFEGFDRRLDDWIRLDRVVDFEPLPVVKHVHIRLPSGDGEVELDQFVAEMEVGPTVAEVLPGFGDVSCYH
ncbi:hypothetical protein M427DRAFT_428398 [Gonapodya prolifera JEL478]|uniref:Tudor-knot domain-containing protein n=1 Tax=Gonapodya prolifera (strain JEL478) TaxID=1344416 RepID=A0A139ASL4_GONPJ|nr:hypothetical protein M427DRAFT_428398 [Gonapodya prolifera JEL478]|eukprot:KXS19731.1 hypothetical protein M427DRAFT_428398 [Gonapodya prolifera JEL478]